MGITTFDRKMGFHSNLRASFKEDLTDISNGNVVINLSTWSNTQIDGLFVDGFTMRVHE
jgi:hypothetical protein